MGKVFTKVKSPLRDYNLESRVHKVLDSTPTPAPRHPVPERFREVLEQQKHHLNGNKNNAAASSVAASANQPTQAEMIRKMALEATEEELNDSTSEILHKNENLLDRMDQIKIVSEGTNPEIKRVSARRMPEDRGSSHLQTIYGHVEPEKIPIGRMSMRQVVETLVDYSKDQEGWSPGAISNAYRIDAQKAANLTRYYRVFDIHLPESAVDVVQGKRVNMQNITEAQKMLSQKVKY